MLPPALGDLRFRVPPIPEHLGFRGMSKINALRAARAAFRKTGVL